MMNPADNRLTEIKNNRLERECFIKENIPFILRCASLSAKRYITREDDIFAVGLEAFNNSIDSFSDNKGKFNSYSATCIKNAVSDYFRTQKKHNNTLKFSDLSSDSKDNDNDNVFEIADSKSAITDTSIEILSLKNELLKFDISFFDLPKSSPPTAKTKKYCMQIAVYIAQNHRLTDMLYHKKLLPVKEITEVLKINKKVPERYRKYIITGVVILKGDYEILKGYFFAGGVNNARNNNGI